MGKARVGEVLQGQIQVNEYLDRHVFKAVSVQVLAQDLLSDGKVHKKICSAEWTPR